MIRGMLPRGRPLDPTALRKAVRQVKVAVLATRTSGSSAQPRERLTRRVGRSTETMQRVRPRFAVTVLTAGKWALVAYLYVESGCTDC
jgi:hypothetical protein